MYVCIKCWQHCKIFIIIINKILLVDGYFNHQVCGLPPSKKKKKVCGFPLILLYCLLLIA